MVLPQNKKGRKKNTRFDSLIEPHSTWLTVATNSNSKNLHLLFIKPSVEGCDHSHVMYRLAVLAALVSVAAAIPVSVTTGDAITRCAFSALGQPCRRWRVSCQKSTPVLLPLRAARGSAEGIALRARRKVFSSPYKSVLSVSVLSKDEQSEARRGYVCPY